MTASNRLVLARKKASVSREIAWIYLIEAEHRLRWWPASEIDPTVGGAVSERMSESEDGEADAHTGDTVGVIDVCIEGHALGFRWGDSSGGHETEVLVTLRSSDVGTDITVTETGFGRFENAYERIAGAQQRWIELLTDFVDVLATAELPEAAEEAEPEVVETEGAKQEAPAAETAATVEKEDELEDGETQIDFDTLIRNSIEGR
ncbi:MAG: SRPBCC family protein [Leucobacter sp.]